MTDIEVEQSKGATNIGKITVPIDWYDCGIAINLNYGDLSARGKGELMVFDVVGHYIVKLNFKDNKRLIEALERALDEAKRGR